MKLTFLGTGTSTGVPAIGCQCETCTSNDPRDKRLRVSALVEHEGKLVLIDTSPDFRQQALRHGINRLDAIFITHCHADHIFGLDDLRPLNFQHGALPVFASERSWRDIRRIFQYVFEPSHFGGGVPQIVPHLIEERAPFCLGRDLRVWPLRVIHGRLPVLCFRLNDFAYVTDLSEMPPETKDHLRDLDVLVLGCLRFRAHPTHLNVERALALIAELRPRRAYLTHISHEIKHARDAAQLPRGVEFAYDGLEVSD
ncbi:MBL fold metallo-hydrolase [Pyrinomonas methylaliphatogenes]|uniref:Metal-dependent hydrolase, beta-lactamase superfamily I n=1 Tax=Pyrinomonas methylaliphatogenes TaxID=454194 RepID=A0A0B6WUV2_9BACT|nr:MBL fold metallo-hydrolase [Pyrinomonas methylaliphatogenes]MBX5478808.1 MBL fold metallo-hydrolase [Pyrinomonas methylaliphatogenes]CDM64517.1 metal-dependent hydrolase, beta-lactamase superfamily I [Pyrinomonas methylaliphatogenes]